MSKIKLNKKIYLLLLLIICLSGFVINVTYAKFTEGYTTSESIADLNYNFNITTNIDEYEMVSVSSDDFEVLNIDITNNYTETNYYGVWYNLLEPSTKDNITVAQVETSANDTSGSISSGSTKTVTVIIKNGTDSNIKLKIGVSSSTTSTSDITYTGNNKLITATSPQPILLSSVTPGSYVRYVGNNGCSGASCMGQNANYVSDSDMGYCYSSDYKFTVNGWRVGYIANDIAYLIGAGSSECFCTSSDGTIGTSCTTNDTTGGAPLHLANLNNQALSYCNSSNSYGSICDSYNSWAMNGNDFENITGSAISDCSNTSSTSCGLDNDLINNNGIYWYATAYSSTGQRAFYWAQNQVASSTSVSTYGLRPVIKLKSNIYAMDGTGTYDDPYIIEDEDIVTLSSGTTITQKVGSTSGTTTSTINHNRTKEYLYLDGKDDYINLGLENQSFASGATLIARVRIKNAGDESDTAEYSILRNVESGGTGLHVTTGKLTFQAYNETLSSYYMVYSNSIELHKWYTVVGTYDNNELRIYVNGSLEGTVASAGVIKSVAIPFAIGTNPGTSEAYHAGYGNIDISDAFIYNRALTAEEVSTYFSDKVSDYPTDSLLSYFHFDAESISS